MKICAFCKIKKSFEHFYKLKSGRHISYCDICKNLVKNEWRYRTAIPKVCVSCNVSFLMPNDKNQRGLYCSKKCYQNYRRLDEKEYLRSRGLIDLSIA
jgi:hypothetical protein